LSHPGRRDPLLLETPSPPGSRRPYIRGIDTSGTSSGATAAQCSRGGTPCGHTSHTPAGSRRRDLELREQLARSRAPIAIARSRVALARGTIPELRRARYALTHPVIKFIFANPPSYVCVCGCSDKFTAAANTIYVCHYSTPGERPTPENTWPELGSYPNSFYPLSN